MNHNSSCLTPSVRRSSGRIHSVLFILLVGAMTARADWPNTNATKWVQYPDTNGLDVLMSMPLVLADDFPCTNSGPITDIHLWTSWLNDQVQQGVPITLSIWSDVPANPPNALFSHPGTNLWQETFVPGQYQFRQWTNVLDEQFWGPEPPPFGTFLGFDHIIWQYNFYPTTPFVQQGTPQNPVVYWLAATVQIDASIGWKTSTNHWNDDAVCGHIDPQGNPVGDWWELRDPRNTDISLDLSFAITTQSATDDFGDAPDQPYPTLLASNGARHTVVPGLFLGSLIDTEANGQPSPFAKGDDAANLADEDGVVFNTPLIPGQNATITVTASAGQVPLNAWIDFGADGSWLTPGDQIAVNWPTVAPPNPTVITFLVPANAVVGPTFARFRYSTQPNLTPAGPAPNGEVEDYYVQIVQEQPTDDFGDAPDSAATPGYPTLQTNSGARHTILPNVFLGALVDAENDGQPNIPATGDDLNQPAGANDEDGVTFVGNFVPGMPYTVQVTASVSGFLDAWVDFNGDGSWAQPSDQIFASQPLAGGPTNLTFTVPGTATWGNTNAYARFRFSTTGGLSYWGPASAGEVEDYRRQVEPLPQHDLGDAPCSLNNTPAPPGTPMTAYPGTVPAVTANFPTALVFPGPAWPVGPIHMQPTNVAFLGAKITFESNADIGPDEDLPSIGMNNVAPATDIPDKDLGDDGVGFPVYLPHCRQTNLTIMVTIPGPPAISGPMYVNVWFDWNRDGDWNDNITCPNGTLAPEWAVQNMVFPVPPPPYPNSISTFTPSFTAWHPGVGLWPIWMRISLAEQMWPLGGFTGAGGDGPVNGYAYGETEDYYLGYNLDEAFDWGDAPAAYVTLAATNGPCHLIVPGFQLGPALDAEADGQPDVSATGDDVNPPAGVNDEDGVTFTPLVRGSNAWATVALGSGPAGGRLDAWVDFDGDGNWWTTPAEQIFASQALVSGINSLSFLVPTNAQVGATYARFRLSSAGGLFPAGAAPDGEVEDYLVTVVQPRPATNVVITQITVTNLTSPPGRAVTLFWNAETNLSYQVQASMALTNGPNTWTNVSPTILGPQNSFTETNAATAQRYYRVAVPYAWP